jgi:hypothetical protein
VLTNQIVKLGGQPPDEAEIEKINLKLKHEEEKREIEFHKAEPDND